MALFLRGGAMWMLYAGIFVYTLGKVVAVLGTNPYASAGFRLLTGAASGASAMCCILFFKPLTNT